MRLILALLIGLLSWPVSAQMMTTGAGKTPVSAPAGYTGPGDVVSGALGFWATRSYNGAYATGSNKGVNVRRANDNATQDIFILTTRDLDIASANTFAGTDASCTGSMVGTTTLTITACSSGTLHINDTLTATGATQSFYITAIGTCGSPPGTCTVNRAPPPGLVHETGIRGEAAALDAIAGARTRVVGGGGAELAPVHERAKMSEPNDVSPGSWA